MLAEDSLLSFDLVADVLDRGVPVVVEWDVALHECVLVVAEAEELLACVE